MIKNNQEAVRLLLNDPHALVAAYQSIIEIVVAKFVLRGFFTESAKMDVIQMINESLLEKKIYNIQRNYNGSVLLSTYFSKVVYNQCLEIARKQKNKPQMESDKALVHLSDSNHSAVDQLVIRDELNRLRIILNTIIKYSFRLDLTLKLYARISLSVSDLQGRLVAEDQLYKDFKDVFFQKYDHLNDKEVYTRAIPFLNKLTNKKTDWDSMRKWLNMQLDKIIELQNGEPPRSGHNRESMKILLQKYFESDFAQ